MTFNPNEPFNLPLLPPSLKKEDLSNPNFIRLLIKANRSISDLNGICQVIPNPYTLLMIPRLVEVRDSSAIEGIYTTIENILESQVNKEKELDPATKEATRYNEALHKGYTSFKSLKSLSTRTIRDIHGELMPTGGMFKQQINKITKGNGEILYTPPSPDKVNKLMKNWDDYVNKDGDKNIDCLIKIAISHYQFEAIHPFSDGNGRTGRIVIILQMLLYNLLDFPVLYISGYLMKNRQKYYSCLFNVTQSNKWIEFITFFLRAFDEQAKITKDIILSILKSKRETKETLQKKHRIIYSEDFLDHIFLYPITHATFLAKELGITYQTAGKYLSELEQSGLLKKKKSGRYNLYYNIQLLECLRT